MSVSAGALCNPEELASSLPLPDARKVARAKV